MPAIEPPINRNPDDLNPEFRRRLAATLGELALRGKPFKFNEGFRTVDRQQWLYGSGRGIADGGVKYGREGPWLTDKNGVSNRSNHQGTGERGTGCAADLYPIIDGKTTVEPPEEYWKLLAEVAEANGLSSGYRWTRRDSPHVELVKK